jgi:hypothetical protein
MQTHGRLRATRTARAMMWRFERTSRGNCGIATSSIGRAAIPEGDHSNMSEVTIQRAAPLRIDGFVSLMNRTDSASTRGNSAALVMKPTVPYLRAQRNQKRPEHKERVVERAAAIAGRPTSRDATYVLAGARIHRIPHIMAGYTVSAGKR